MATIVISSTGTHGDYLPYIALGQFLKAQGHTVRMAFRQSMHSYVINAGLEAVTCGTELTMEQAQKDAAHWDHFQPSSTSLQSEIERMIAFFKEDLPIIYQQLLTACEDADLFICGLQRQMFGAMLQKKLGLPWVATSVTPAFQCSELSYCQTIRDPAWLELFLPTLKEVFAQLNVEEIDWLNYHHNQKSILGSSPYFSIPTNENSHYQQTGFWFYEDPTWQDWQPSETLRQFVETNSKHLFLTFSSIPVVDPRHVLEVHIRAAQKLGRGLIVQRGWANFNESLVPEDIEPKSVMFVDFMPQDWLLSNVAAIIHHGGVGTIARALRNSCPMLVEPLGNDQFFNAKRILALKVGTAVHPHKITSDGLAKILETKVLTEEVKLNTQYLSEKIQAENSLEKACTLIESWLL